MLLFLSKGGSSEIRRHDVTCHWGVLLMCSGSGWMNSQQFFLSLKHLWVGLIPGAPASLTVFHCIVHFSKHVLLFLGFFPVLQKSSRDPEKCPQCICSRERVMEQSEPPNLRKKHHCRATKHLGTCSWSTFSWWPCEGGRARAKGARGQCRLHRGNSEGESSISSVGTPFLNSLSQWWFYRHISFYCTSTCCILQVLFYTNWRFVATLRCQEAAFFSNKVFLVKACTILEIMLLHI